MGKCQPIREVTRELNTTYFHDKRMALDVSLFISGPPGADIKLVIDRAGGIKIIEQFSPMNGDDPENRLHYVFYTLEYTDEYSVKADEKCEIQIWREVEREEQ